MKLKRVLAFCLAAVLALSVFGCANQQTSQDDQKETEAGTQAQQTESQTQEEKKDPVTLVWYYSGNGPQKDTAMVEEAFNELLKNYEGMEHVTVKLNTIEYSDYASSVALDQSAGQQMDIIQTFKLDFASLVADESIVPLNELLEQYPNLKNEFADWIWGLGSVGEDIYFVPCIQRAANRMYFIAPKEYIDNYGDADEFRTLFADANTTIEDVAELLERWLIEVRKGEGDSKYLTPLAYYYIQSANGTRCLKAPFDKLADSFVLDADSTEVSNIYTDDMAQKAYEITAEWYEKGYVHQDMASIAINDYIRTNMMNDESFIFSVSNGIGDEELESKTFASTYGFDVYAFPINTPAYVENVWAAGGQAISASCEHPEEAMRLIELLNTAEGEELYNMLIYGIEGVHYTKIDDEHIQTLEYDMEEGDTTVSFAGKKWLLGNTDYAWLNQGNSDVRKQLGIELNKGDELVVSKLTGFMADVSSIDTQLAQVKAVVSEYGKTLRYGVMGADWEATYKEFTDALNAAGYQDVIDELQSQIDEFLK